MRMPDHFPRSRCAIALVIVALGAMPAASQVQQAVPRATAQRPRVYLTNFAMRGSAPRIPDLDKVVTQILQLELLRLPIVVEVGSASPICGQSSLAGLSAKSDSENVERFNYVIVGEVRSGAEQFQALYDVWQCQDSSRKQVVHELRSIPWNDALPQLTSATRTTSSRLRDLLPRVRVTVAPISVVGTSDETRRELASTAMMRMSEAIWGSDDLEPVDSGGDYVIRAEIHFPSLKGRITRSGDILGKVTISKPSSAASKATTTVPATLEVFSITGTRDSLATFLGELADRTVEKVDQVRFSASLGTMSLGRLNAAQLVEFARDALCYTRLAGCRPNRDAAITALRIATRDTVVVDSVRFNAFYMLGDLQFHGNERGEAIAALQRAAAIAGTLRDAHQAVADSLETFTLNHLGQAYFSARNYPDAANAYRRSLAITPAQTDIVLELSRSLRELGQGLEAIRLLASALQRPNFDPADTKEVVDQFEEVLGRLEGTELAANMQLIDPICRQPQLRQPCSNALSDAGVKIYGAGANREQVIRLFRLVDNIAAADAYGMSRANAYLALLYVSDALVVIRDDNLFGLDFPSFKADSMDLYLSRAEKFATGLDDKAHADWLTRLRSRYWFAMGARDSAFTLAAELNRRRPSNGAAFLAAEAALFQAIDLHRRAANVPADTALRQAAIRKFQAASALLEPLVVRQYTAAFQYDVQANHVLRLETGAERWDMTTRVQLEAVLKKDTVNVEALQQMSYVCVEYLKDFECGYHWVTERPLALGMATTLGDSLNAVEAAVLYQKYDIAERILTALTDREMNACHSAVRYLYRVWIAAAKGQRDRADAAYAQWRTAATSYRDSAESGCWLFDGAGVRIRQETFGAPYKERRPVMMLAITEKKKAPMP